MPLQADEAVNPAAQEARIMNQSVYPSTCDMKTGCLWPVTHIDEKGYVYCSEHGVQRRDSGIHCRQLKPWELNRILRGEPIERY